MERALTRADSGRLKYLFACDSVTIQRPVVWEQHFHPAIDSIDGSPTQNTVIVRNDSWADLPRVIQELEANPRWARLVARNARDTFRHRCDDTFATSTDAADGSRRRRRTATGVR